MGEIEASQDEMKFVLELEKRRREEDAKEEELRVHVLQRVRGGIWHTTNSKRFQGILSCCAVLPEPNLPDSERWSAAQGSKWYPYVRTLGGVSLFDFRGFNRDQYSKDYPLCSWETFVPFRSEWNEAVWIEIDFEKLGANFIGGDELLRRWKEDGVVNRIMPLIEGACLGPVPLDAFKTVFRVSKGGPIAADDSWLLRSSRQAG